MKKIVAKYINNKLDRRYEVYDGDNLIERGEYDKKYLNKGSSKYFYKNSLYI